MDLLASKGYIVVLVVVDQFSKGVWFIPFSSLPTTRELAETLFQAAFLPYGILDIILSD